MGKSEKRDYRKEFCALMDRFAFWYSRWQVWTDFLTLSAISLDDVVRTDFLIAVAAVFFIPDAGFAFFVKLVKVDVIVYGGLIQSDWNQYKPHGNRAFVCNSHSNSFFPFLD